MNGTTNASAIRQRLEAINFSPTKLAAKQGLSHATVLRAIAGGNVTTKTMAAIYDGIRSEEARLRQHLEVVASEVGHPEAE